MRTRMILLLSGLLALHVDSYAVVAYTPQALRECINAMYQMTEKNSRKKAFEELHTMVRENRMLTSDAVAYQGVAEAIEIMRSLDTDCNVVVEYLESYLNNLHNRGILLALDGDASHKRSWPMGLISRSMRDQQDAYNLLCLSNELSNNLTLCGCADTNMNSSSLLKRAKPNPMSDPAVNFTANQMTNVQSSTPSVILGGTGVSSPIVVGWDLTPSTTSQSPVNMQFTLPGDLAKHQDTTLELALLVPYNGLADGYAKFQVNTRYVREDFNLDNVVWTSTSISDNIQITESSVPGNLQYVTVQIPLSGHHLKAGYFALLSISRVAPTGSHVEYGGDVVLVSAVYRYTAQ